MMSIPFFSEQDGEEIAYSTWLWDAQNGRTICSWEQAKATYRERAEFVVECLNNRMATA